VAYGYLGLRGRGLLVFGYCCVCPICIGCPVVVLLGSDMVVKCMCIRVAIPRLLSLGFIIDISCLNKCKESGELIGLQYLGDEVYCFILFDNS
jgi:hypothetical protein